MQQPSLVHLSFISLAPPRDGNSHSSDDIAPLISNDSLTLSSEEFAFSNTIQPPWMRASFMINMYMCVSVDSQPTMEETILVGDDLMMGPPSPVVPPEIASHVLRGVDLCDGILKNLFLCLQINDIEPFCQDELALYKQCAERRDKEIRNRLQESERKLGSSMPFDEAKERVTQLEKEVTSLDRRLILASGVEGMEGFRQRWSLHGRLTDTNKHFTQSIWSLMWPLYLLFNKILKTEDERELKGDNLSAIDPYLFQHSPSNNNVEFHLPSLRRSRFVDVPHVNQIYTWEYGLACASMVLKTIGVNDRDIQALAELCCTNSHVLQDDVHVPEVSSNNPDYTGEH
ncbi:hypothetical protein AHAS_Ahas08G0091000 [Arachis hypogaea]